MKAKSLIETNPYLQDARTRKEFIARSVRTSCGVEGVKEKSEKSLPFPITHKKQKRYVQLLERLLK